MKNEKCKCCFFYDESQEDCNFTICNFLDKDEYYYYPIYKSKKL